MPVFEYRARDTRGQLVTEKLAFRDELSLREHLRKNELFVIAVSETATPKERRKPVSVGLTDLIVLVRNLRTILNAGVPLVSGLQVLSEQTTNPGLSRVLMQVCGSVGHGVPLADALGEYPQAFPPLVVALVRAGESGGRLPDTLQEAGRQLELFQEIRQKLISAIIYPLFTLVFSIAGVLFMLLCVVPVFQRIYQDLQADLPAITQSLVFMSELLFRHWLPLLLGVVTAGFTLRNAATSQAGRAWIDRQKLRLPLFGPLFIKTASATMMGTLAGLTESGVPLVQALEMGATTCGNEVISAAALRAARSVETGGKLSVALEQAGCFPLLVVRMIAMAEEVGTLPQVLREIATSYNTEVDYAVRRILSLVEPVMVLVVGAIITYVLVALYYPIFLLSTLLSGKG